jgi:hypothetical protein
VAKQKPILSWIGWGITALIGLGLSFSAVMKFLNPPEIGKEFVDRLGYPADVLLAIGIAEITSVLLFLFPRTAVLGAVLLTGYLGGAIATHVRIHDNFAGPAIGGVLVWLALYFRDPRVRELLPLRSKPVEPTA